MNTNTPIDDPLELFIEGWGRMGAHWGVGKVMAEIQALLYLSREPLSLEDMAERLKISRSNVSMNVRALQDLGVVRKVTVPGDRRDYYCADDDIPRVARRLAAEKKKRELEPAIEVVERAIELAAAGRGPGERRDLDFERLDELKELLDGISAIFDAFIHDAPRDEVEAPITSG